MTATVIQLHPRPAQIRGVPGKLEMRWRVLGCFYANTALWGLIIWGLKCL